MFINIIALKNITGLKSSIPLQIDCIIRLLVPLKCVYKLLFPSDSMVAEHLASRIVKKKHFLCVKVKLCLL